MRARGHRQNKSSRSLQINQETKKKLLTAVEDQKAKEGKASIDLSDFLEAEEPKAAANRVKGKVRLEILLAVPLWRMGSVRWEFFLSPLDGGSGPAAGGWLAGRD